MYLIVLLVLLTATFINIYADDDYAIVIPDSVEIYGNPLTSNDLTIPESLLIRMSSVKNFTQFMNEFLTNVPYIYGRHGNRKTPTPPAVCEPYPEIVELPKSFDPLLVTWPRCIRLKRCSGCSTSSLLTCVPTKLKKVSITVLKAKYSESGSEKFDFQSQETVKLEEHEKCSFQCKEKASDCSSQQIYKKDECRCVCKNQHRSRSCHKDQIWDSEVCECKCKNYSKCSTGLYFNTRTCRCDTVSLL
ncbi:vascular endothelial growth factor A-like [Limulus polyphemus]|uniref:Vascular endothelial growth factor A-like n=1 Tax=Limulus polyphemus TaxID=6850 RepID=A0ABM1SPV7_LIMPO|nr:vascular endothelial growth factor A-like [Limulus polyphemus]